MPPEAVPSNASIASTGKGIRYVGEHCYAYSGNLTLAVATQVTAFDFTSGSGVIAAKFQTSIDADALSTSYFRIFVTLNGVSIIHNLETRGAGSPSGDVMYLTIPPFTEVVIKLQGDNDATATAWLTGRVYE